jgi:hypothetical protein
LSPRKGDDPKQLVSELDDLVRRMIAVAPERQKAIHENWGRLKHAFLGPATPHERTERGRAKIQQDLISYDYLVLSLIAGELFDDGIVEPNMMAHGLAGAIHDVLMKLDEAKRPPWFRATQDRRARVKTVGDKLRRHVWQLLKEEFPEDTKDELKAKMKTG